MMTDNISQLQTKHAFQGDKWLGFERLAVVPIQTKMVRETMLSRDEIAWIKVCSNLSFTSR